MVEILKHKPKIAVIDCDFPIFSAASSPVGEQVRYIYSHNGIDIADFDSAIAGKNWIDEIDMFGLDPRFNFTGDVSKLERRTEYEAKSLLEARKHFEKTIKQWLKAADVEQWIGRCSATKGAPSFRNDIATISEYKGNRKNARKPIHLDKVRKYALTKPEIKKAIGGYETDDVVCSLAQKGGKTHVLVACDKDARGVSGCWYMIPGEMSEPEFSPGDIVGTISVSKGKLKGHGWLFWLAQSIVGDTADNYKGCIGAGPAKAVDALSEFNNKPLSFLSDASKAACSVFKDKYGESYSYPHWNGSGIIEATYKDIFLENFTLAYMVKSKKDKPSVVIDAVNSM